VGKSLDELASYFRPTVDDFLGEAEAAIGEPLEVIDTGRTPAEQQLKLAQGVSWTEHSKHEPQPPEGKSEAIDVCPKSYLTMKGWNPAGEKWAQLGAIGEKHGMFWGRRWTHINNGRGDPGHFQYVPPPNNAEQVQDAVTAEN
jgi:hypothetical protein